MDTNQAFLYDLMGTPNTNLVGDIGEFFARWHLVKRGIHIFKWGPGGSVDWPRLEPELPSRRKQYLLSLMDSDRTWSWDYIGIRGWRPREKRYYLIEVKTSRVGKKMRGLKSNWRGRSRQSLNREDLLVATKKGFRILLINVQLLDNCLVEIREREYLPQDHRFAEVHKPNSEVIP